jgi:transcriptional regulator with XRE-family HTH domain
VGGIARQVVELREKHRRTQVEGQISRIERGVISPTSATLAKIAEALGADLRLVERQPPKAHSMQRPARVQRGQP